ncbi:MAG TPA: hypothetical protein VGC95_01355 [Chitinophagaceae bacterium]
MKKIMIVLISVLMVLGASAQRKGGGYHYYHPRTRVIAGFGVGYYPYYGMPPYNYYWDNPYYGYHRPSRLELQIEDIRADYNDKIWSARHDKSMPRRERKKEIHELKAQRDAAIRDAERNYHRNY